MSRDWGYSDKKLDFCQNALGLAGGGTGDSHWLVHSLSLKYAHWYQMTCVAGGSWCKGCLLVKWQVFTKILPGKLQKQIDIDCAGWLWQCTTSPNDHFILGGRGVNDILLWLEWGGWVRDVDEIKIFKLWMQIFFVVSISFILIYDLQSEDWINTYYMVRAL